MSLTIILVHIGLAPKRLGGLEVWGIDFPDTLMEFITSAIVVVQVERVAIMAFEFIRARYWRCTFFTTSVNLHFLQINMSAMTICSLYNIGFLKFPHIFVCRLARVDVEGSYV